MVTSTFYNKKNQSKSLIQKFHKNTDKTNQMTTIDLYDELVRNLQQTDLPQLTSKCSNNTKMDEFQLIMIDVRADVQRMRDQNKEILRRKDKLVMNTLPDKQNLLCENIRKITEKNYGTVVDIKNKMERVKVIIETAKTEMPDEPETFSKIYRKKHLSNEIDKVLQETYQIQKLVEKYSYDTNLKRIRLILPEAGEEQVQKLATKQGGLQQAVASRMTSKASQKLKYMRKDILQKSQGIKKLQQSVQQNLRLIKEVAMLVEEQGEMIDNIYENVMEAKDYVEKAEKNLVKEKEKHKASKKRICCIILVGIIILGLILVPIILKVVNSQK